jgi:phage-related protein
MTNQDLQKQLELFKSQMKEVNESLQKFEFQFGQEKAKIEKLKHSFFILVQLINQALVSSFKNFEDFLKGKNPRNK